MDGESQHNFTWDGKVHFLRKKENSHEVQAQMAPDPRKNDEVKSGVERKGNRGKGKFSSDAQASGKGQQVRSELNFKSWQIS